MRATLAIACVTAAAFFAAPLSHASPAAATAHVPPVCTTHPCQVVGALVCNLEDKSASIPAAPFMVTLDFVMNNATAGCVGGSITVNSIAIVQNDAFLDATGFSTPGIPVTPFVIASSSSLAGSLKINFAGSNVAGCRQFDVTMTGSSPSGPVSTVCSVFVVLLGPFKVEALGGGTPCGYLPGTEVSRVFRITNLSGVAQSLTYTITSRQTSSSLTNDHYPIAPCGTTVPPGNPASPIMPTINGSVALPAGVGQFADVCFATRSYAGCQACSNNKYDIVVNDVLLNQGKARMDYVVLDMGWGGLMVGDPSGGGCVPPASPSTHNGVGGPIADLTTNTFNLSVATTGVNIQELQLQTFITHTFASDLDIRLTSPAGTTVAVTTDNGAGNDNVFNGTLWEDSVIAAPVTDHVFTNLMLASPLNSEGSFGAFCGEDPNGTWTLIIVDDLGGDFGNLASWSLDINAASVLPPKCAIGTIFTSTPGLAIPDNTTVIDTVAVSGVGTVADKVVLFTEITHTFASDLDITLTSPSGTVVKVTTDNGGGNDNVFNGTLWDEDSINPVSDHVYVNLITASTLSPEGAFGNFRGENPLGIWTLSITDDAGGDIGNLVRWYVSFRTCEPCGLVVNYCTPGTTTNGCLPTMFGSGTPSASQLSGFLIGATGVEGQKQGVLFYGNSGPLATPWSALSNSFLCVKSPSQRLGVVNTGGTAGACDGTAQADWHLFMANNGTALGNPRMPGQSFWGQLWFRDPPAPKTTNLSDGLMWTLCP